MKYLWLVYLEQVAAKIPPAREGRVEVRPVRELNPE